MRLADTRPPFAGLANLSEAALAALLVDHDAVRFQGVEAAAVELTGEQALAGAEGIGGVHDDEVVLLLAAADILELSLIHI